jgi:hypothetical protein
LDLANSRWRHVCSGRRESWFPTRTGQANDGLDASGFQRNAHLLVLPALTNTLPVLTPLAGVGLALIMLLAGIFHFRRGEYQAIIVNLVLGLLAAFIAYGRFVLAPLS